MLFAGCTGPQGLLNFVPTRSFVDRSKVEMQDFIAETVAAEMSSVKTEMKDFTAETVATTTQTIYGDAKWVVIGMLGLVALGGLAWTADRLLSLHYKRTQAKQLTCHEAKLDQVSRMIENGGPPNAQAPT